MRCLLAVFAKQHSIVCVPQPEAHLYQCSRETYMIDVGKRSFQWLLTRSCVDLTMYPCIQSLGMPALIGIKDKLVPGCLFVVQSWQLADLPAVHPKL